MATWTIMEINLPQEQAQKVFFAIMHHVAKHTEGNCLQTFWGLKSLHLSLQLTEAGFVLQGDANKNPNQATLHEIRGMCANFMAGYLAHEHLDKLALSIGMPAVKVRVKGHQDFFYVREVGKFVKLATSIDGEPTIATAPYNVTFLS